MRALLDLMREKYEKDTVLPHLLEQEKCRNVLRYASSVLKILDPEFGDKELIESVAAGMGRLQGFVH